MGASASKTIPPGLEDLKALDPKESEAYKKAFEKGGISELKSKIDGDINHWKNVPVNIALTGNSGVENRFTENDLWLAKEVQSLGKKFFFIRTKINSDVLNNKIDYPELSKVQTVENIRSALTTHLTKGGFPETRIFLIDNHYPRDYDFPDLMEKMIDEAPEWKQEAMILTMTTLTEDIIRKKKEAIQKRIMIVAFGSAAGGAIPIPGVGVAVDIAIVIGEITFYRKQFGLEEETLESNAKLLGMSSVRLKAELDLASHLIGASVRSLALALGTVVVSEVAESVVSIALPIIGSAIGASLSYGSTVAVLRSLLDVFVKDALAINNAFMVKLTYDDRIKELKRMGAGDACISGHDGRILAKSDGFNASKREIATVIKAAKGETISDDEKLELQKVAFMKIDSVAGDYFGCKLISKSSGEKVFCCAACSDKVVVFVLKKGQNQRKAVGICENEVKYLKDIGK